MIAFKKMGVFVRKTNLLSRLLHINCVFYDYCNCLIVTKKLCYTVIKKTRSKRSKKDPF